jgi:hypothetical protein
MRQAIVQETCSSAAEGANRGSFAAACQSANGGTDTGAAANDCN